MIPLTSFNIATFSFLFQALTWISSVICRGLYLCSMIWGERWRFVFGGIIYHHHLNFLFVSNESKKEYITVQYFIWGCLMTSPLHISNQTNQDMMSRLFIYTEQWTNKLCCVQTAQYKTYPHLNIMT